MRLLKFLHLFFAACIFLSLGCKSTSNQATPDTKLPGTIAISPSSFHCEGKVIAQDADSMYVEVSKILAQGSSLFYPVSAGDTIVSKYQSSTKSNFSKSNVVEMIIEERLKLNSEKPEFIIKQIR